MKLCLKKAIKWAAVIHTQYRTQTCSWNKPDFKKEKKECPKIYFYYMLCLLLQYKWCHDDEDEHCPQTFYHRKPKNYMSILFVSSLLLTIRVHELRNYFSRHVNSIYIFRLDQTKKLVQLLNFFYFSPKI